MLLWCESAHMVSTVPLYGFQHIWSSPLYWAPNLLFHNWPPHWEVSDSSQTCSSCMFILVNRYCLLKLETYVILSPPTCLLDISIYRWYDFIYTLWLYSLFCHWLGSVLFFLSAGSLQYLSHFQTLLLLLFSCCGIPAGPWISTRLTLRKWDGTNTMC